MSTNCEHESCTNRFECDRRVEVPCHSDEWMQGDRYGDVIGHGGGKVKVLLDKSRRVRTFSEIDVRYI